MRVQEASASHRLHPRRDATLGTIAGAIACLALGGAANAQSMPAAPGLAPGKHLGVVLSATATYDTNVVGGSDLAATVKGLQKDDITYSPNASVTGAIPLGPGSVYVVGNIGYLFHQFNPELNSPKSSIQAGLSGPVKVGPCALSLILGYTASPTDQSQLLLQTIKNTQSAKTIGASASCTEGGAIGQSLSVVHVISTNSAKTGTTNSDTTSVMAGVSYQNRVLGDFMINGAYSTTNYNVPGVAGPVAPFISLAQGFESYSAGVSLARPIGQRLSGIASLNYTLSHPLGGAAQSSSGLTGSGGLTYRVSSRIAATLSYHREQQASIQLGSSYSTNDEVIVGGTYTTPSRLSLAVNYRLYRRQEHISDPALLAVAGPLGFAGASRESGNGLIATAGLPIGRNGQFSLNLGRTYRNTNLTVYNYTDYTAGLSLTERF